MPFESKIIFDNFNLYLWKIEETEAALKNGISIKSELNRRLKSIKSIEHRKRILSIYQLIRIAGISDNDLFYNSSGAPILKSGKNISISHSKIYSGIVLSKFSVGIDIESFRKKIINISSKFLCDDENSARGKVEELTLIWTAKEAIYKAFRTSGISFSKQIKIDKPFSLKETHTGKVFHNDQNKFYDLSIIKKDSHIITVACEKILSND